MQWFVGLVGGGLSEPPPTQPNVAPSTAGALGDGDGSFAMGELVEYYSTSTQSWITAKVLAVNGRGTYNLDCKPDVSAEKIRKRTGAVSGEQKYAIGDLVEYLSTTHGWITAKVLGITPHGSYNLDCKPDVPRDKLRAKSQNANFEPTVRTSQQGNIYSRVSFGEGGFKPEGSVQALPRSSRQDFVEQPVQLVRAQQIGQGNWRFEVCPEGAHRLQKYGTRPISIISVCGPQRSGKTFLLNLLSERSQQHQGFASTGRSGTEGLWLFGTANTDDESGPLIALLDCEGLGGDGSGQAKSAKMLTLCGLLSSVLILNTKGALNDSIFKQLGPCCRFGDYADLGPGVPRGSNAAFVWLLRDFMMGLQDSTGRQMAPDEYMEQALLSAQVHDQALGGNLRQNLRGFFSRMTCAMMVKPTAEESQLQALHNVPYTSLRSEFRASIDVLRTQLFATCRASAKSVSGQPLGCNAFVALTRQLVDSLNNQLPLNLRNAWEALQHGNCAELSDQLRAQQMVNLKTLQAGEKLPGGAQLPLSDEALRMVFRQQHHDLKAQWEHQAVGYEVVRKEYWQDLKESFARDERMISQQNAKLADQRLKEALQAWQNFLDDDTGDGGSSEAAERIASELGLLMERMPTVPLSRAARSAIEAAARRVVAARREFRVARDQGAAPTPLKSSANEPVEAELREAKSKLQTQRLQLEESSGQLKDAKAELERLLADADLSRARERELKTKEREFAEREAAWRAELENCHDAAAKAQSDHLHSERVLKSELKQLQDRERQLNTELGELRELAEGRHNDFDSERLRLEATERMKLQAELEQHESERRRLEDELENFRNRVASTGHVEAERQRLETELERVRSQVASTGHAEAERQRLETELERVRLQCAAKGHLEKELESVRAAQDAERARLQSELDRFRQQCAATANIEAELELLRRTRDSERAQLEAELEKARLQGQGSSKTEAELRALCDKREAERQRLEVELERARSQCASHGQLEDELEKLRASQAAERNRLEQDLSLAKAHAENKCQLEVELQQQKAAQAAEREKLEKELEGVRGQAAERVRVEAELERLRATQTSDRQKLEGELEEARSQAAHKARLEEELEQAKKQAADQRKLQDELEQVRAQAEEYKKKIQENTDLKHENEKTRENLRIAEQERRRLEEERRENDNKLGSERERLLAQERDRGVLQEKVNSVTKEADSLRGRVEELQKKVYEAEGQKGQQLQEKDQLRQDLERARTQMNQAQTDMQRLKEEYETRLKLAEAAKDESRLKLAEAANHKQPKCCIVQ